LPPHQDRRLQLRMLGFVALIGLAMFTWQAFRISSRQNDASQPQSQQYVSPDDFHVTEETPSVLKDDEVRIVPRKAAREELPDDDVEDDLVGINPSWLTAVEDNTVGIRQDEADAFYQILEKAQSTPLKELQAHSEREALFVNLMTSPAKYRGRPVTLIGELRKLFDVPAPKDHPELSHLYEAWICTEESGENPYRVVCSSIPPELKPQESSRVMVKVTGYFFKREGYQTWDGRLHVAPTILAGRLSLYISPQMPPPVEDVVPWMIGIISVVGLAMLATVIGYALSDSRSKRGLLNTQQHQTLDVAQLAKADHRISIEESLRRLEEADLNDEGDAVPSANGNGYHAESETDTPDEVVDLPTPFPPTRVPPRWENTN
jgi:hypothetical protein